MLVLSYFMKRGAFKGAVKLGPAIPLTALGRGIPRAVRFSRFSRLSPAALVRARGIFGWTELIPVTYCTQAEARTTLGLLLLHYLVNNV